MRTYRWITSSLHKKKKERKSGGHMIDMRDSMKEVESLIIGRLSSLSW